MARINPHQKLQERLLQQSIQKSNLFYASIEDVKKHIEFLCEDTENSTEYLNQFIATFNWKLNCHLIHERDSIKRLVRNYSTN